MNINAADSDDIITRSAILSSWNMFLPKLICGYIFICYLKANFLMEFLSLVNVSGSTKLYQVTWDPHSLGRWLTFLDVQDYLTSINLTNGYVENIEQRNLTLHELIAQQDDLKSNQINVEIDEAEEEVFNSKIFKFLGFPMFLVVVTLVIVSTVINIGLRKKKVNKVLRRILKYRYRATSVDPVGRRPTQISVITPRQSAFNLQNYHWIY